MNYKNYLAKNTYPNSNGSPIISGHGIDFEDENGKEYKDFSSQTLNLLLGQTPTNVVEAVIESMKKVSYASSRFSTKIYVETAGYLNEISPIQPNRVNIKMCDGSDANETAIKTARKYTGKPGIISFVGMHTGQTTETINIRGYARDERTLIGTTEAVYFVTPPHDKEDVFNSLAQLNELFFKEEIAGVLLDPLLLNAGLLIFDGVIEYYKEIEKICKNNNALFILDENQTFGWFDNIFFAKEYGLSPDIITLGKGLTAGILPLAGVIIKEYLDGVLDYNEADFTNGGNPSCCMACKQTITELKNNDFQIEEKSKIISERLEILESFNPKIQVRGIGIIWSFDFINLDKTGQKTKILFEKLLDHGLFLRQYGKVLIMKPPVIVTKKELEDALNLIIEQIGEIKWDMN